MEVIFEATVYGQQSRGGISRIFNEIIPRICNHQGVDVSIVALEKTLQSLPKHSRLNKVDFSFFDGILRPRRIWRKGYELFACASFGNTKNKVLHATYFHFFKNWRGPKVLSVYDMIYERYPNFFHSEYDEYHRKTKKEAILLTDKIICISNTTAKDLISLYPACAQKVSTIPLAYKDTFRVLDSKKIKKVTPPFILYVGSRGLYKNFSELIKVFSLWKGNKEFDLYTVGPEWTEDERRTLAELKMEGRVRLYSDIDDEMLCSLYNQASAFIYPSMFEGFGIPLLEAMACGCPIIASPIPSTKEVAGDIPVYFELNNSESFLCALDSVILEGRNSERTMKGLIHTSRYSWDRNAAETIKVYETLV